MTLIINLGTEVTKYEKYIFYDEQGKYRKTKAFLYGCML